jgi:hypothetical protein
MFQKKIRLHGLKSENIDCDLYLYDGPPKVRPIGVKMIAFTSPNFVWLDSMRKNPAHRRVYMPVWKIKELQEAVKLLELKIEEKELPKRYKLFGGSARYCLSLDENFVDQGIEDIKLALGEIKGFDQVEDCFNVFLDLNKIVHRLMHYNPDTLMECAFASLFPASVEISVMLMNRLDTKLSNERAKLIKWLDKADKASVFSGWLFENFTHEILFDGGDFGIRSQDDSSIKSD